MTQPSALSLEQVEMQVMLCQGPHSTQIRDGAAALLLDHFAAQRATMAQQAQEIERLTVELLAARAACEAWGNQVATEREQLAAMTKEKEALDDQLADSQASGDTLLWQLGEMRAERDEWQKAAQQYNGTYEQLHRDLATAQARVKELEAKVVKWQRIRKPTHGNCCTCQKCGLDHDACRCDIDELADELTQLQATLAAKEAKIVELADLCRQAGLRITELTSPVHEP